MDKPISVSQEQIFAGCQTLKACGVLPPNFDHVQVMIAVSRAYNAMRRLEQPSVPEKEVFAPGRVVMK
jgi:hypothetical protein